MRSDRRACLRLLATAALLGPARLLADPRSDARSLLLSCRSDHQGRHFATLFAATGKVFLDLALPGRGHGIALSHDRRTAVVFARRPGEFMVVIDLVERREHLRITAADGRHFYGHGAFSPDDGLLYATENAFDQGTGRIGIYAVDDAYRRIGEFDSQGIGPHELCLYSDGQTLVVANGGIRTHPDMPRAKLNLERMRASLAYIDRDSGQLQEHHRTPPRWQKLSIRHIAVAHDGRVAMAMQYEGAKRDRPPLVALHRPGTSPRWLHAPPAVQKRMRNYCGSIAFAAHDGGFAVSSPRGGVVTRWSADGDFERVYEQADVCGLAASDGRLWASDGQGRLAALGTAGRQFADTRWDNHLTGL